MVFISALALGAAIFVWSTSRAGSIQFVEVEFVSVDGGATAVEPIPVMVRFRDPVQGDFSPSNLEVRNANIENFRRGTGTNAWEFDLAPRGEPGTPRRVEGIFVRVRPTALAGGRTSEDRSTPQIVFDSEPPAVRMRLATGGGPGTIVGGSTVGIDIDFNEAIPNFTAGLIEVSDGAVVDLAPRGGMDRFRATIRPTSPAPGQPHREVVVRIAEARDAAGNRLEQPAEFRFLYDDVRPTVAISSPVLRTQPGQTARTREVSVPIAVVLSEPIGRPLAPADFEVSNGVIDAWAALDETGLRYEGVVFARNPGVVVSISIPGGRICDPAGNCATAALGLGWFYEGPEPTPTPTPTPTPESTPTPEPGEEAAPDDGGPLTPSGMIYRRPRRVR